MAQVEVPQVGEHLQISIPQAKTLLVRLNRPEALNCMNDSLEADLCLVMDWFESNPSLWVCVLTGAGKAFCCGQDLKAWLQTSRDPSARPASDKVLSNPNGFGSISRRISRKPIIAALNGTCLGGGAEMLVRCDIVIGYEGAIVGFPEVKRGVVASQGGIPHALHRSPAFAPYLLTGENIPQEVLRNHLFTDTVRDKKETLKVALQWAKKVTACSPDAVMCTKDQINLWQDGKGMAQVARLGAQSEATSALYGGKNIKEGLESFVQKRPTKWVDAELVVKSKL